MPHACRGSCGRRLLYHPESFMYFLRGSMHRSARLRLLPITAVLGLCLIQIAPACAQVSNPIRIDASQPFSEPASARYDGGAAKSPSGRTLMVNSRYLVRDGKPWLPVVGEFHYSRYPESRWEEELLKMKAAGVQVVAAYVIWIHHEEVEGQFDWTGQRDLRAFAQLCAKH